VKLVAKPVAATPKKVVKVAAKPVAATEKKVVKLAAKPVANVVKVAAKKVAKPQAKVVPAAAKPTQKKAAAHAAVKVALAKKVSKVVKVAAHPMPKVAPLKMRVVAKLAAKMKVAAKATKKVAKVAPKVVKVEKVVAKVAKVPKTAGKPAAPKVVAKAPQPKAKAPEAKVVKVAAVSDLEAALAKPVAPAQKEVVKAVAKPAAKVEKPIAKAVTPIAKAATPIAKALAAKPSLAGLVKLALGSNSSADKANASVHVSNQTAEEINKTKVIEEAVVSLPMAGFALDLSPPPVNVTPVKKFPGNATQKAEWDKKEKFLEHELTILKLRLAKANSTPAKPVAPAATGTFNSNLDTNKNGKDVVKLSAKSVASKTVKVPVAPMEPIRKVKEPKAVWPTMKSVAAPVALHHVLDEAAGVPPTKTEKVMGTAFTGTPAKKVQSVMALDTTVVHDAVVTDDREWIPPPASLVPDDIVKAVSMPAVPTDTHAWFKPAVQWVTAFFNRVFGGHHVEVAQKPKHLQASLLDTSVHRGLKQDMERTAEATREQAEHSVALTSVWSEMEEEDRVQEETVRNQDVSERQRAKEVEPQRTPTKEELKYRHGADMASFWSNLEKSDADIEKSVTSGTLGEYEALTAEQEAVVSKAASSMQQNQLHTNRERPLKHNDNAFLFKTIHDPWESLEKKDAAIERKIHDSPDLQMLQLQHSWKPLK